MIANLLEEQRLLREQIRKQKKEEHESKKGKGRGRGKGKGRGKGGGGGSKGKGKTCTEKTEGVESKNEADVASEGAEAMEEVDEALKREREDDKDDVVDAKAKTQRKRKRQTKAMPEKKATSDKEDKAEGEALESHKVAEEGEEPAQKVAEDGEAPAEGVASSNGKRKANTQTPEAGLSLVTTSQLCVCALHQRSNIKNAVNPNSILYTDRSMQVKFSLFRQRLKLQRKGKPTERTESCAEVKLFSWPQPKCCFQESRAKHLQEAITLQAVPGNMFKIDLDEARMQTAMSSTYNEQPSRSNERLFKSS